MNRKRNHYFPKKSDYWDAVNQCGEELVNSRNKPPILPEYQVFFETESHYALFDLRLREKHLNIESIRQLDDAVYRLTNHRVNAVRVIRKDGLADYIYKRPDSIQLTPDSDADFAIEFFFNFRDKVKFVYKHSGDQSTDTRVKAFMRFFCTWFTDSLGKELKSYNHSWTSSDNVRKWQLKTKQRPIYSSPHSEFQDTQIEKIIEQVLTRNGIRYRKQSEFFIQQMKFTVPDFLLEDERIAIYCDGTEFHKDTQKIIRDKTQDRKLQINGYMVLRFSGSEIISDLRLCEEDILSAIARRRSSL